MGSECRGLWFQAWMQILCKQRVRPSPCHQAYLTVRQIIINSVKKQKWTVISGFKRIKQAHNIDQCTIYTGLPKQTHKKSTVSHSFNFHSNYLLFILRQVGVTWIFQRMALFQLRKRSHISQEWVFLFALKRKKEKRTNSKIRPLFPYVV